MDHSWTRRLAWLPDPDVLPAYRRTWGACAVVVVILSAAVSSSALEPATTLLAFLASFSMVVTVSALYAVAFERPWWSPVVPSFVASILFVQWVALLVSSGWVSVLLLLLVATAPRLLSLVHARGVPPGERHETSDLRRLARERAWVDVAPADAEPPATEAGVARLSDRGLCRLWRDTARDLGEADVHRGLQLVRLRDACLEEMARRDPEGFTRWLGTDPVSRDPAAFLRSSAARLRGARDGRQ